MTKLGLLLAAATITLASLVACSSSDSTTPGGSSGNASSSSSSGSSGNTTSGSPTTSSSSSSGGTTGGGSTWAQALCAWNDKCNPGENLAEYGSTAACATAIDQGFAPIKAAPDSGATDAGLATCATAIQGADCTKDITRLPACVFKGKRANGAGCALAEQCSSGVCTFSGAGDGDCGKCADAGAVGATCFEDDECAAGLSCSFVTDTGACATPAATGGDCTNVPCADNTQRCINNKCVAAGAKGATCTPDSDTTDDSCGAGLICSNGTCATVAVTAQTGQTCSDTVQCIAGSCVNGKCAANLAAGATCDDEASDDGPFCGGALSCGQDGKCDAPPAVATCN